MNESRTNLQTTVRCLRCIITINTTTVQDSWQKRVQGRRFLILDNIVIPHAITSLNSILLLEDCQRHPRPPPLFHSYYHCSSHTTNEVPIAGDRLELRKTTVRKEIFLFQVCALLFVSLFDRIFHHGRRPDKNNNRTCSSIAKRRWHLRLLDCCRHRPSFLEFPCHGLIRSTPLAAKGRRAKGTPKLSRFMTSYRTTRFQVTTT
jgi:hypothetical protein